MNDKFRKMPMADFVKSIGGKITSSATIRYNCIAWSVGLRTAFIWPEFGERVPRFDPDNGSKSPYWPYGDQPASLDTFLVFYEKEHGFVRCDPPKPGTSKAMERVVLYCYPSGLGTTVSHASRQRADGRWESKLGVDEDIIHNEPEDLQDYYGCQILTFLERPRPGSRSRPWKRIVSKR